MVLTVDVDATPTIRLICALLFLFPALIGMILQFIVIASFYKGWKSFRNVSFYLIMIQIIVCNIYSLFLFLYIAFPITLLGVQYMGDSFVLYYGPLIFEGVAYTGMLLLTFLITVNRLTIFVFPRYNGRLFSVRNTIIMSGIIWAYILTIIAVNEISGCRKLFSKEEFYFWYDCAGQLNGGHHYNDFLIYQEYVIATLMGIIYLIVYAKIRISQRNSANVSKNEKAFLIQTIPLSILFATEIVAFKFTPTLEITGQYRFFVSAFDNLIMLSLYVASPILLLIFNRDVRKNVSEIISSHKR